MKNFVVILFVFVSLPAFAEEPNDKQYLLEGLDEGMLNNSLLFFDEMQNWLGNHVDDIGEMADDFFGTEESFDRSRGSRLDILFPVTYHSNGSLDSGIDFRAKIELPRTNNRWNLIIESAQEVFLDSLSEEGDTNSPILSGTTSADESGGTSIGLRFKIETKAYTLSFLDLGLNFKNMIDPDPYLRVKGTYKWLLSDRWTSRMIQNLFWERHAEIGLASRQVFDYTVNDWYLLRSETRGTWWDKNQTYDLSHNFIFFQKLSKHRAIAYRSGWNWQLSDSQRGLTHFNVGLNLRERVYKSWLFVEIEPRVDFSKSTAFNVADPNITILLEAQFYDTRKK